MKHLKSISLMVLTMIVLVGCATYKSSESGLSKVGYEENLLNDGFYQLTYYGAGFTEHDELIELWHRRAGELCSGGQYESETKNQHWISDSYTVLPPFFFKSKSSAPSIEGKLRCNGKMAKNAK